MLASLSAEESATIATAQLAWRRGQTDLAQQQLKTLLQQAPYCQPAYEMMFALLGSARQYPALLTLAEHANSLMPQFIAATLAKVNCLRALQQHERAIAELAPLLKTDAPKADWFMLKGLLLKEIGQFSMALVSFNQALSFDEKLYEAYWLRADTLNKPSKVDINQMQQQLEHCTDDRGYAQLCYALARAFEKNQDFSESFSFLTRGANAKRRTLRFNIETDVAEHQHIARVFNKTITSTANSRQISTPVFICGLPRSGTTLVEQILSSHPDVSAGDELFELAQATADSLPAQLNQIKFPLWAEHADTAVYQTIGQRYLQLTERLQKTPYFTDKMPLNYKAIGVIRQALPQAKIVYCQRHPMDTVFSCYKQLFADGIAFSYQLDELASYYRSHHNLMQHWLALYPNDIIVVTYEQLVRHQERETRELLCHLGLSWDPSCLQFHKNSRAVYTVSSTQVRKPLYSQSIGYWQHYAEQLQPAATQLQDLIDIYEQSYAL
ncbi:sulfotransferase [Rheinheimera baltica]|uniref:tetratricopeptide repeat-containing sulfotransferase family protein n=1 Tax=Rheinheimera baltica TaxID=67576 RepID=UPI00273D20EE|nr:sulfotransferase [Rheinheimera baltica]MDP5142830.1 sulfotransferase [Rheinheimera baltica]